MKVYEEIQPFHPFIKWFIVSLVASSMFFSILMTVLNEQSTSEIWTLIIAPVILVGIIILFLTIELRLKISIDMVQYQFFPLEWKMKKIDIQEIKTIAIVHPKWFSYGGFGKRKGIIRKTTVYKMSSGPMLEMCLMNGKKLLFSIKNENQMNRFLKENFGALYIQKNKAS